MIQKVFAKIQPMMCVVKGCAVGLKSKHQEPVGKGWKLAATHELLADRMSLPCMCGAGVKHAVCEGSLTRESAYYTPKFAEGVTQALLQGCTHEQPCCVCPRALIPLRGNALPKEGKESGEEQECECDLACHPRCETCCAMCERAKVEQDPLCLGTDLAAAIDASRKGPCFEADRPHSQSHWPWSFDPRGPRLGTSRSRS